MPGERFDVGGYKLHAHVTGAGSPVVVLEPALGAFRYAWLHVQRELEKLTTVVSYDRAGQGWSDPSPHARTPERLSDELHRLLGKARVPPPYLLVGHSFGGLLVRNYAGRYPEEVLGAALVDASYESQYDLIPNFKRLLKVQRTFVRVLGGLSHLEFVGRTFAAKSLATIKSNLSPEEWNTLLHHASRPGHHRTVLREFGEFGRFFGPTSEIPKNLGDLPLAVVTAGDSLLGGRAVGKLTPKDLNDAHLEAQKNLTRTLSTRARQTVVEGASHQSIIFNKAHALRVSGVVKDMLEAGG